MDPTLPSPLTLSQLTLRDARPEDAAALAALKRETFRESFVDGGFRIPYPAADLARFEAETYGVANVAAQLADPARRQWVVEDAGGALVAYAQICPCKLPHAEASPDQIELSQLYLRDAVQGRGLGGRLLDVALEACAAHGGPIWIGVWSGNVRARAIYEKRGFRQVGAYKFAVGDWLDDEVILRRDAR